MNVYKFNSLIKNALAGLFVLTMVISIQSCSKKINFLNSSVVPAARGTVKVNKDNNKNYVIEVELQNLAEVKRLPSAKNTYVIWMKAEQNITKNIGQIKSSTGTFSNKLKANFETISSLKPTKIFITAEDDGDIQYPSSETVLTTDDF